jgi:hypothetical protein
LSDRSLNLTLVMAFISSTLLLTLGVVGTLASSSVPDVSISLQDILNKAHQGPLYTYPTSLTQGIVPVCFFPRFSDLTDKLQKGIHSHNDCKSPRCPFPPQSPD